MRGQGFEGAALAADAKMGIPARRLAAIPTELRLGLIAPVELFLKNVFRQLFIILPLSLRLINWLINQVAFTLDASTQIDWRMRLYRRSVP